MQSNIYPKWKVAVISTDYDLHYLRDSIESSLEKLGFEVIAFERPDYPVYPEVHSHQACLLALQISDIVVLLIDRRYGGLFMGKGQDSITEKEYFEAYNSGKIIIPCVQKKSEDERNTLFNAVKQLTEKDNISLEEARKKICPSYVDKWEVLDLIEKTRKAPRDNFTIYFENVKDIQENLKGRLQGLTRFICHKIIKAQIESVKSIKTTTFALSLGDVLNRGYFIEPPYKILSGEESFVENASHICDLSEKNKRIMIIGEPGFGKSTLLIKSFLKHAETNLEQKSNRIPFYLSLRGLGPNYHFDFKQFINDCCTQYLRKDIYPIFESSHIEPVFYIDGFDELAEQSLDIDLQNIISSTFFSSPFIVSSRTRFAKERLESLGFWSQINTLIELIKWKKALSWEYIKHFCHLRNNDKLYINIFEAYNENKEMQEIFENPLLLTMFLWIVEDSGMKLPLDIRDTVSVYEGFIDLWIKRELGRTGKDGLQGTQDLAQLIIKAWQVTAWEIYKRRFIGEAINQSQLNEILESCDKRFEEILNFSVYKDFLDINSFTSEIRGMFHEQFMEHLLAKEIISCCKEEKYPFPEFLEYEIRSEINKIIRALWKNETKDYIKKILQNLWTVYEKHLNNIDVQSLAIRNHAMYYIGRLPEPDAKEKLRIADSIEKEMFVKLSIAFGLMKLEDYDKEDKLFENLKSDENYDKANRGYHLVYYGDWILKHEEPPYRDDGTKAWGRTYKALLQHIQSKEERHIALRRIELFTIRRFIETRESTDPMTKEDLGIIKTSLEFMNDKPQGFLKKVNDEFIQLEKIFDKIDRKVA